MSLRLGHDSLPLRDGQVLGRDLNRSEGTKPAGRSKLAQRVNRWQRVAGCERDNVFAPGGHESIGNDEKCVGALLGKRGKTCVDLAASSSI